MITAHRIRSPIGKVDRHSFELKGRGWTLEQVVAAVMDPAWPEDLAVEALVDGELVTGARTSKRKIAPGSDVTVSPTFQGVGFVHGFLAVKKIWKSTRKPKVPEIQNLEISPTYNFRGIGTQKGAGSPIAIGYGEMRVGQQFIASYGPRSEHSMDGRRKILVQVALGIGPWNAIGGLDLGLCGEADFLGGDNVGFRPLPAGLRVNDAEIQVDDYSIVAHVRSGSIGQSPMPHGLDDVSTVYGLTNYMLVQGVPRIYTTASDTVDRIVLDWRFPQGLYRSKDGRQIAFVVEFDVRFRKSGETAWGPTQRVIVDRKEAAPGDSAWTQTYDLAEVARWEVEITRRTADDVTSSGADYTVSTSNLETVTEQRLTRIAYPRIAVLGLEVQGNERLDGDLESVTLPCQMRKIRRNNSGTWSTREYVNAADATKITGKNPAWIVADLLTLAHYGGGALGYEDADIDVAAFEAWADYCDELVPIAGGTEARHQCSIYFDATESSLDAAIAQVCTAGRAVYIREGSRHTVAFDGPKERAMLITSERVDNVSLTYSNPSGRPTVYVMQILDEDSDWDLLEVPVEDADAKIDVTSLDRDQLWQERVNLKGVTRRTEAVREAGYRHRVNYYRDLEVSFDVTRWAVPLTIYDRFALSLHVPRWYASVDGSGNVIDDGFPIHCRTSRATTSGNTVYLDREFELVDGETWAVEIQAKDGSGNDVVEVRNVVGTLPIYAWPDRGLEIDGAAITCDQYAQVVVGKTTETTIDFVVTSKTIDPEGLKQTIRAERYDANVYDPTAADAPAGLGDDISEIAVAATLPAIDRSVPAVTDVRAELVPAGDKLEVRWTRPTGGRGHRYRVYRREVGGVWSMHAETSEDRARIAPTRLGTTYEISVASKATGQAWSGPDGGTQITVVGQEFPAVPPPEVAGFEARQLAEGIAIEWSDASSGEIDYYELRRGEQWFGGEVVARTRDARIIVPDARSYLRRDLSRGENYLIRARHRNGLYSADAAAAHLRVDPPDGYVMDIPNSQLPLQLSLDIGTYEGCSLDITDSYEYRIRMDPDAYEATYTLPELDPGSSAKRWWSVAAGADIIDATPLGNAAPPELIILADSFGVYGQFGLTSTYAQDAWMHRYKTSDDSLNGRAMEGAWLLARDLPADLLVVEHGINDVFLNDSLATMQSQMKVFPLVMKAPRMIMANVSPFGASVLYTGARETVRTGYNAWLPTQAASNVTIWDIDAVLRDPATPANLLPAYDSGDGIHPNAAGHAALTASLNTLLDSLQDPFPIWSHFQPEYNHGLAEQEQGEQHFRTIAGRDASPQNPGSDAAVRSDSSTVMIDDPSILAHGRAGVIGHAARLRTELRVYDHVGAAWGAWTDWHAQPITAQKIQARVRMTRASLHYDFTLRYMQCIRAN